MPQEDALSRLTRYESLFEISSEVNSATEIERAAYVMASRLKYLADVYSWRYIGLEHQSAGASAAERQVMIIDGYRGQATISHILLDDLSSLESGFCVARRTCFLSGDELEHARTELPAQFHNKDISQLFGLPHIVNGELQGLSMVSRRRAPFDDVDIKFITLAAEFFHEKSYKLWEQRKLRELQEAYLQQEISMRQNEKLATLGRLSAGIAHEINNPGAAVLRGSEQLQHAFTRLTAHYQQLMQTDLCSNHYAILAALEQSVSEMAQVPLTLDALERSDREYELETLLDSWDIDNAWELAPTLVKLDYRADALAALEAQFGLPDMPLLLGWMVEIYEVRSLLAEIHTGSERISEVVAAMKSYSYMDQAELLEIDLHQGLQNTLVILRNRLKAGVTVHLDFAEDIPPIQAYGSELNQVWTNIIDNAIDAMEEQGELRICTRLNGDYVVVTIEDDGPGIPAAILPTITDPFVTTKPPGEGTGMGLYVTHNIVVQKHKGQLSATSEPGKTVFRVALPVNFETVGAQESQADLAH